MVEKSISDVEYRVMALGACDLWQQTLLYELELYIRFNMLQFDSTSAQKITTNAVYHKHKNHVEVDCHFIRRKMKSQWS